MTERPSALHGGGAFSCNFPISHMLNGCDGRNRCNRGCRCNGADRGNRRHRSYGRYGADRRYGSYRGNRLDGRYGSYRGNGADGSGRGDGGAERVFFAFGTRDGRRAVYIRC